jgi:hypothetical protein
VHACSRWHGLLCQDANQLLLLSGLAGVYVTVPNTLDVLDMLDWACLAPRPQHCPAGPGSTTGYKAPPAAASAPSTPLSKRQVPGAMYKQGGGGWAEKQRSSPA